MARGDTNKGRPIGTPFFFSIFKKLDKPGFFERFVCAVFSYRAQTCRRNGEYDGFVDFRHKNALFLEVGLLAHLACGVKFGRADAVAVSTGNF